MTMHNRWTELFERTVKSFLSYQTASQTDLTLNGNAEMTIIFASSKTNYTIDNRVD